MATNLLQLGSYVQQGFDEGRQQGLERRYNRLAGQAFNAPDNATRDAAVGQIAVNNPSAAMTLRGQFQEQDDRNTRLLTNMARYMKGALDSKNDQAIAGAWKAIRPALIKSSLATEQEISPNWDPSYEQTVHQLLAMGDPGAGGSGPYADLPSDIRSLKLLQENPELAQLDRERRQAGGMVPKLVQTAQGYGWGTPGSAIELAPMGGIAGQGAVAPQRQDMEADIALANDMISAGIPADQVDAFIASRGSRVNQATGGGAPNVGGIAQPYRAPPSAPSGYRETPDGGLQPIPGGPADMSAPSATAGNEQSMRKELSQRLAQDQSVLSMYRNVQSAATSPSAAGDLSMIFAFMKMLDPGSVVREQEFANAQNAAGVPDQIRNAYNRAMSGQRLNPNQRADFLRQASDLAANAQNRITSATRQYQGIADQYGYDPQRATGMADFRDVTSSASTSPSQQPARPMTEQDFNGLPSGALYIDPDDGRTYRKR